MRCAKSLLESKNTFVSSRSSTHSICDASQSVIYYPRCIYTHTNQHTHPKHIRVYIIYILGILLHTAHWKHPHHPRLPSPCLLHSTFVFHTKSHHISTFHLSIRPNIIAQYYHKFSHRYLPFSTKTSLPSPPRDIDDDDDRNDAWWRWLWRLRYWVRSRLRTRCADLSKSVFLLLICCVCLCIGAQTA